MSKSSAELAATGGEAEVDCAKARYRTVTSIEEDRWDDFVFRHTGGNIFQTPHLHKVYSQTKNYSPVALFAIDASTGELCGVLCSVVIREFSGPVGRLSARAIVQGGPLVAPGLEPTVVPLLLMEHDRIVGHQVLYSEVRNLHAVDAAPFERKGYRWRDHLNFVSDLTRSEAELWDAVSSRRRRSVNRSSRMGVRVRDLEADESLEEFYDVLRATHLRSGVPLADLSLFETARSTLMPRGLARFVVALLEDSVIACKVLLVYRGTAHAWYAGSTRSGLSAYPNDLLGWDAIQWSKRNSCVLFDFGGGGRPDVSYGPREFKRQFGGEQVNFGRMVKTHAPLLGWVSRVGFELYRRIAYRVPSQQSM